VTPDLPRSPLPFGLVTHNIICTVRSMSDETIAEIADQEFLPLVAPREASARSRDLD
jgi:hypothetical protein